jgi:transcriptional regulator with XRE-family HTH domain
VAVPSSRWRGRSPTSRSRTAGAASARRGWRSPLLVGGEGRLESALLAAGVVAKVGAEGVFAAGWRAADGTPRGLAVKAEDGADRAATVAAHAVLVAAGVVAADVWSPAAGPRWRAAGRPRPRRRPTGRPGPAEGGCRPAGTVTRCGTADRPGRTGTSSRRPSDRRETACGGARGTGPGDELDPSAASPLHDLGSYIRHQRESARLSLRNLAKIAGVSNPYLSQIERGLRKPSAEILQAIAKALEISSETLYVKAGILEEREPVEDLESVIARDPHLTAEQRQALIEMYRSFRQLTELRATPGGATRRGCGVCSTP